jgi:hypothetical protein
MLAVTVTVGIPILIIVVLVISRDATSYRNRATCSFARRFCTQAQRLSAYRV